MEFDGAAGAAAAGQVAQELGGVVVLGDPGGQGVAGRLGRGDADDAAGPTGPRGVAMSWAAMKPASLTSAGCAGCLEMTQPSGRFHRCT